MASTNASAAATTTTTASVSAAPLSPVSALASAPLCASACRLAWQHAGGADAFSIERADEFGEDRAWHAVGQVPGSARAYESVGLLGGGGRTWRHRVRPLSRSGAAGPWSEVAGMELPASLGGPRGTRLVEASARAPRNISGSFIALADGSLLYAWTASANLEDNAPSWIEAIALEAGGRWVERGTLFPSAPPWTCVSRPSFARLRDGGILATYSIGRATVADAHDGATSHFEHRYVARISRDEARTWSEPRVISDRRFPYEMGNSNGTRNVVLESGRVVTNVHCCKPQPLASHDPFQGRDIFNEVMGTYLLISDDDARTWRRVPEDPDQFFFVADDPYGRKRIGFWEIAVVEHAANQLLMYGRNASGWLYETRSQDGGSTWSALARTHIPYPIAPPNLTRIPGTATIVHIGNPHVNYGSTIDGGKRSVLATQCSDDAGATWHGYRELEYDGLTDDAFWSLYSYPDFAWHQGRLHIIYSRKFNDLHHQALTPAELTARA